MKVRKAKPTRFKAMVEAVGPFEVSVLAQAVPYPAKRAEPTRVGSATVETIPVVGVSPLVTLDDPSAPLEAAQGAFARLRPPVDHPAAETACWRDLVAARAIAVRVVAPPRRREGLPPEADRPTPAADVRAEATAIAAATNDPEVVALVEGILSEVEGA